MSIAIKVENLGKKYMIRHEHEVQYDTLRDELAGIGKNIITKLRHPFDATVMRQRDIEEFWALKDVSFEVEKGDRIGVIGRNGAGKSTLLKVLSRITEPTTGKISMNGRIASLLEVGTGFHPELTGRENIYLNGAILGMSRVEIRKKFDEIVDFADVEKFLDTPVKRYSSGMYVRLAFSIAAHLEPEILIVDEVLAVGDVEFQKKCLGRMEEAGKEGRTVLFVSHNIGSLEKLCTKGIFLENGMIQEHGNIHKVINSYLERASQKNFLLSSFSGPIKHIEFNDIYINGKRDNDIFIKPSSHITIDVSGICYERTPSFNLTIAVYADDVRIFSLHDTKEPAMLEKGPFTSTVTIPEYILRPGKYTLAVGGHSTTTQEWIYGVNLRQFIILEEWDDNNKAINIGVINIPFNGKRI